MGFMKKLKILIFLILQFCFHKATLKAYLERYMCAIVMVDSALETLGLKLLIHDYHKFFKLSLLECIAIWMMEVLTEIIKKMSQNECYFFRRSRPLAAGAAGFKLVVCVSKNCNRPSDRPFEKNTPPPFVGAHFKKQFNFVLLKLCFWDG